MRRLQSQWLEPSLLATGGLICSRFAQSPVASSFAAVHAGKALAMQQLSLVYGLAFGLLAIGSYLLARKGASLWSVVVGECKAAAVQSRAAQEVRAGADRLVLYAALLIGGGLRAFFLSQPMRYDESVTFLNFADGGFFKAFLYQSPNNHVLNSLLEKFSCMVAGSNPWAIRLPAFTAGMALIVATAAVCRRFSQGRGGSLAALGLAAMPFMVLFSTSGRGYALLALIVVLAIHCSLSSDGKQVSRRWGLAAVLSALGMLVMPSMLYAIAGICVWIFTSIVLETRSLKDALNFLIPYLATTAITTILLYTPVVLVSGGFAPVVSNRFIRPIEGNLFLAEMFPHIGQTVHDFLRDIPDAVVISVAFAAIAGIVMAIRDRNFALALLLPALLVGSMLLFVVKRSLPFTRTWIYLIPIALISADAAFTRLCRHLAPRTQKVVVSGICITSAALAFKLAASNAILAYPDTGIFPDAEAVAARLAPLISRGDVVCAEQPADVPIAYYLWRAVRPAEYASRQRADRKFFVQIRPLFGTAFARPAGNVLASEESYILYEWTDASEMIVRSTCWSPSLQAGA